MRLFLTIGVALACVTLPSWAATNLVSNGDFADDLTGWTVPFPGGGSATFSAADAGSRLDSGSLRIDLDPTLAQSFEADQCIEIEGDTAYRSGAKVALIGSPGPGWHDVLIQLDIYDVPGCPSEVGAIGGINYALGHQEKTWTTLERSFVSMSGARSANFRVLVRNVPPSGLQAGWFDDVFLEEDVFGCDEDLGSGVACLRNRRFQVSMSWTDFAGNQQPVSFTKQTQEVADATFQNNPNDVTVTVKVTNGCPVNGNFWVWIGAFTQAGFTVTVQDLQTGTFTSYVKAVGGVYTTLRDTVTFPCL